MKNTISIRSLFILCGVFVLVVTFGGSIYAGKRLLQEIDDLAARNEFQRESENIIGIANSYLILNKYSIDNISDNRMDELKSSGIIALFNTENTVMWSDPEINSNVFEGVQRSQGITSVKYGDTYIASIPAVLDAGTSSLEEYALDVFSDLDSVPVVGSLVGYAIVQKDDSISLGSELRNRYLLYGSIILISTIVLLTLIIYQMIGRPLALLEKRILSDDAAGIQADYKTPTFTIHEIRNLVSAYLKQYQNISSANVTLEQQVEQRTKELADLSENLRILAFRAAHDTEDITKRIAAELHDDLCSVQISLKRRMELFLRRMGSSSNDTNNISEHIVEWIEMTDQADTVARNIIGRFQNIVTDYLGLEAGLKDALMHSVEKIDTLDSFFINRSVRLDDLDPIMHVELVKIVQEAVRNVVSHTNATRLTVSVDDVDENVVVCVSDNGGGFERSELSRSFGLQIMEQRAVYIHGSVHFMRTRKGTDVIVTVPFKSLTERNYRN